MARTTHYVQYNVMSAMRKTKKIIIVLSYNNFIISLKRLFFIPNPNEFHFFINFPSEVKNSSKKRENVPKNVPEKVVAIAPILTIDTRIDISSLSWSYSSPDEVSRAVCVCLCVRERE